MTAEVRHPKSRVLLRESRRMIVGEVRQAGDKYAAPDGTWKECPQSRIGDRVEQEELDHGNVWARPTTEASFSIPLGTRIAVVHASMGMMHRLR